MDVKFQCVETYRIEREDDSKSTAEMECQQKQWLLQLSRYNYTWGWREAASTAAMKIGQCRDAVQ